jgi:hypothetical protein
MGLSTGRKGIFLATTDMSYAGSIDEHRSSIQLTTKLRSAQKMRLREDLSVSSIDLNNIVLRLTYYRSYLQLKLKLSHYTPRRCLGEGRCSSYSFSTSALDESEWSALRPGCTLAPGKDPGTHCTGGWVGPRAGLDTEATGKILSSLPGIKSRSSGCPARSQTL